MAIKEILDYENGFPLFSHENIKLRIGNGEKIIISDIWPFWDYIIKRFVEKNHENIKTEKVLFSLLEQAKYFYQSGEKSPIKSQALLYYYSFLNLSKIAYIISKRSTLSDIKSLKYTHGISEVYSDSFKTSEVSIKTSTRGATQVAHEIIQIFDLKKAPSPDSGSHSFNIRDILSHCIGVHRAYSEIYRKPEFFIKINELKLFKNAKTLYSRGYLGSISKEDSMQLNRAGYNIFKYENNTATECIIPPFFSNYCHPHDNYPNLKEGYYFFNAIEMKYNTDKITNESYSKLSQEIKNKGIWYFIGNNGYTMYLSKCEKRDFRYSQETIIYMVMFFLGSITRYSPFLFDSLFSDKEQWLVSEFLHTQPKQFLYLLTSRVLGQSVLKAYVSF